MAKKTTKTPTATTKKAAKATPASKATKTPKAKKPAAPKVFDPAVPATETPHIETAVVAATETPPTEATAAPVVESAPAKKTSAKPKKVSALDAAAKVLGETDQPLNCQEMIAAMAKAGYWTSPGGKTPHATLYSAILREINTKADKARFRKAARGKFTLAPNA